MCVRFSVCVCVRAFVYVRLGQRKSEVEDSPNNSETEVVVYLSVNIFRKAKVSNLKRVKGRSR